MWSERRLGRFFLSEEAVMPPTDSTWLLFRELVVISAMWSPENGRIEYLAWSPRFRELKEAEISPYYTPSTTSSRGVKMVEWTELPPRQGRGGEGDERPKGRSPSKAR